MTNRDRFLESLIHRPHTVLGRELRPFCLWHMIHLSRVHSPFLGPKCGTPSLLELMLAVAICQSGPETPLEELTPDEDYLTGWGDDYRLEVDKFRCYRRDYAAVFVRKDGKGEPLKCPWELAVMARLMRYGHYTKREALTEDFGFALNLAMALGEANGGDCGVLSAEQERCMRAAGWIEEGDDDAG